MQKHFAISKTIFTYEYVVLFKSAMKASLYSLNYTTKRSFKLSIRKLI